MAAARVGDFFSISDGPELSATSDLGFNEKRSCGFRTGNLNSRGVSTGARPLIAESKI